MFANFGVYFQPHSLFRLTDTIQLRCWCRDTKFRTGGKEKFETLARARTGSATRVEHLSDTLGPVGPLFSHRFRLGKHGFNRCFTHSVPGTGSSIWDPRLVASELWARRVKRKEEGTGAWDKWRSERGIAGAGIHAPGLRAHFACQAQFRLGPGTLERSLFSAAVYGRHYLDRPRVGLNDLFVCTFYFIGWHLLRDTCYAALTRHDVKFGPVSPLNTVSVAIISHGQTVITKHNYRKILNQWFTFRVNIKIH